MLMMLENYVGADKWQEGVRSYLDAYAWSNATEPDLWKEISAASGIDVSKIAGSFLNQPGFPILSVDKNGGVSANTLPALWRRSARPALDHTAERQVQERRQDQGSVLSARR